MHSLDEGRYVSDRTQAAFHALAVTGADLAGLLALISNAFSDGGNHVLDQLHARMSAESDDNRSV